MDQVQFTAADAENLQRLIDGEPLEEPVKSNARLRNPNMFLPQFETLLPPITSSSHPLPSSEFLTSTQGNAILGNPHNLPTHLPLPPLNTGAKDEPSTSHFMKYREQEGKSIKVFECGICGKEFGHQYTLMRHLPTHTDERKFNCLTCGKAFRQMSTLSQHRAIHSSERPYVCEVCCKTFNRVSTLISHRKTHTGVKPHRCHLCNKAFHQKGNLRNHIFTHTNERPYKCDICKKGFNQMSNLMCHKLKAHQQYDVIPKYTCKICGEDFLKRISLRQHEQFQHGMGEEDQTMVTPPKFDYSNAIIVDPIKTEAMRIALQSNKTPFALLRPLSGIPVLVRVLPAGSKQLLVPATAEDLKKHGHISITPKAEPGTGGGEGENKENQAPVKSGSVVQIKVPVVATVIQRPSTGGDKMNMSVVSPGPDETMAEGTKPYVFSNSLSKANVGPSSVADLDLTQTSENIEIEKQMITDAEFQFLDENQKLITEQEFTTNFELTNQFDFNLQTASSLTDYSTQQMTPNSDPVSENPKILQYHNNFSMPIQNFVNNNFNIDLAAYNVVNNLNNPGFCVITNPSAAYATDSALAKCSGDFPPLPYTYIAPMHDASATKTSECNAMEYTTHGNTEFEYNKSDVEIKLSNAMSESMVAKYDSGENNDVSSGTSTEVVVDVGTESMVVEKVEPKPRGIAKDMPLLCDFEFAN